jgi:putative transposase
LKILSEYSRSFHTDHLTAKKHGKLKELGRLLLDARNELSAVVYADPLRYQQTSKISFQKEMLPLLKDRIHSNFVKQVCDDVHTKYQNRFAAIKKRMIFEKVAKLEMTFYKVNTKKNKKGDPKGIVRKAESTPLTKVLSYLARYGSEDTPAYVANALAIEPDESKRKFYTQVMGYIEKFGMERLLCLALSRREQVLARYPDPIEFKSLSFRGRSRLSCEVVSYNRNYASVIKAFINIGWTTSRETLALPVKYSKSWHGSMKQYTNGTDTSYTVCFDSYGRGARIVLSHEGEREYPDGASCTSYVGFDVNSKHNQMVGSNGIVVDHNREALAELLKELLKIDAKKEKVKDYQPGPKRQRKLDTLRRKIKHHTQQNCSDICKRMVARGEGHAAFENLNNGFGKSFAEKDGVSYNRIVSEMHLSSVKDEFAHIAPHYGIATSTVHSELTSQECHKCGYTDPSNRVTQEDFECQECGHVENADSNASNVVGGRLSKAVLRDALLTASKIGNGTFEPKAFRHWKVKEILLSLRYKAYPPPLVAESRESAKCL